MKNTFKRAISVLLAAVMLFGTSPLAGFVGLDLPELNLPELNLPEINLFSAKANAAEEATSGTCGANLTWSFDEATGALTISGTGEMTSWNYSWENPWSSRRSSIKTVTIGNGVTTIGSDAFCACTSLASITIPDSVTTIGSWAFENCDALTSVTIGKGLTTIGSFAFSGCGRIENVYYTGDVSGWCAIDFYHAYSNPMYYAENVYINGALVKDLIIPEGVTSIGDYAFCGCESLTNVIIPDGVTSIGYEAFYCCDSLESVTIGNGVTSIGGDAFRGCTSLENVYYTGDVAGWCAIDFDGWFTNPMYYAENLYINGALVEGDLVIPEGVTAIGRYSFYDCDSLTSVTIPNSVTTIGSYAFSGCNSLTSVTIPASVTIIGSSAFSGCNSLTSVTIPDGVTTIGDYTFSGCNSLTSVTIPDSVTSIGHDAFYGCTSLESVTIPDSVTSIDYYAFRECTSLESVTIPDSVTSIGARAFWRCTSLESVTIPDSVTSIGFCAFYECTSLENVYYTGDVAGWCAIEFEDSDSGYNANPASEAENLYINGVLIKGNLIIPDGVTSIGSTAFYYCTSLTSVTIPDSVTTIGNYAFYNCTSLESVTIGNSVTTIGSFAFWNCDSLTSVTIPVSVTNISRGALSYNVKDVYYAGSEEQWEKISIDYDNDWLDSATIHFYSYGPSRFKYTRKHTVSDYQVQNAGYAAKYFAGAAQAMDGSYGNPDLCIPGISLGENMVPQGIAYYEARNWMLISAYYKDAETDSRPCMIFALDCNTGRMVAEFKIRNKGNSADFSAHVGGIAVSEHNLYITGNGADICRISLSQLDPEATEIVIEDTRSMSGWLGEANAAYLSINDGMLITGNFFYAKDKKYDTPAKSANSVILAQNLTGASAEEEWQNFTQSVPFAVVAVPDSIDRIQGAVYRDNKFYLSSSFGRKNTSSIIIADIDSSNGYTLKNTVRHTALPMMEGMTLAGNYIYAVFESAAAFYQNGLDGKGKSSKPTDVVWKININKLLGLDESATVAGDVENQYAEYIINEKKGYTYLTFKQSWFGNDSINYNHFLGRLCSQFAVIGYDTAVEDKDRETLHEHTKPNLKSALEAIGMTDIEIDGYTAIDEVNTFIAHRKINVGGTDYTLVFAGFIGSQDGQWYNNFDPGTGTTHAGFESAKNHAYGLLEAYIQRHGFNKSTTKILLTGHSRGAATANLVAAELIRNQKYAYSGNIYTYAFATPNSTSLEERKNEAYNRIFNIVNPEDFVPTVLPSAWGYGRYGKTFVLPSKTNTNNYSAYLNNMQQYFTVLTNGETYEPYADGEIPTYFTVTAMTSAVKNVSEYYSSKLQAGGKKLTPYEFLQSTLCHFVSKIASALDLVNAIAIISDTVLNESSERAYVTLLDYFVVWSSSEKDTKLSGRFNDAHRVETYCSYMMSMSEEQIKIQRSGYLHTVNCPVDIEVYDREKEEVVGRIVNNVVDEALAATENAVVMTVKGDSKSFWLPADGEFDIRLIGNDNGVMDYTVSAINSADATETKRVNFVEVEIIDGKVLTGVFDAEKTALEEYSISTESGNKILPDDVISSSDIGYYNCTISVSVEGNGEVSGAGDYTKGDYVSLFASPLNSNGFIGWYDGDTLLSTEQNYSFVAKGYLHLVAKFGITLDIATPSETIIKYGDSIVLHANMSKELPSGWKIAWEFSNGNFSHTVSSDSYTCTITPAKSGDTTVTVILYDAEGNEVSRDEQAMTSKAGFFDKIIAFFKKLFSLTEVYDRY